METNITNTNPNITNLNNTNVNSTNINNEELLVLLQTLGVTIQKGLGGQQDLGATLNMMGGKVEFLSQMVTNQNKQIREEFILSNTSISAKIAEIDKQLGVLQDNLRRLEKQVSEEEEEEEESPDSLNAVVVTKIVNHPGITTALIVVVMTLLTWGTALVQHFTGREVDMPSYPSLEKGLEQRK